MVAAIDARGVERSFGKTMALRGVSFVAPENSVYTLIGSNGAGKSTLIQILMRLIEPTAGEAWIQGLPVSELFGERWTRIGYISEEQKWPGWMTVEGLLEYLRPFYPQWDRELEGRLLAQFDLPLRRKLKSLSRGMRMKAAFTATLPFRPAVLVLDEPLSGLDPLVRDELIDALQGLRREGCGFTTFLSSHDLGEVEGFATHIGFLDQGRMLFSEEMATLKKRFRKVSLVAGKTLEERELRAAQDGSEHWIQVMREGQNVEIVLDNWQGETEELRAAISEVLPGFSEMVIEEMPLRAIFLATAKACRTKAGEARA